jgi:Tol biopolymer transport system component
MRLYLILILLISAGYTAAQFTEFHPELDWYTIKGENIEVHYHDGAERTARVVAKIADEIWDPITSLYQYVPEKVHYVIKDIDDYSNGATYFFDNKIEIWTSALDFDLRGTHNWLRNVISHEFTHMVQIQASLKTSRSVPAVFLQMLNYEDERRPDILYGFPNVIVTYPVAFLNMPAWFAEGTAQYMRREFAYEDWDSHRDMILRSYALDNKMLSWNEMGVFGKTSLGNESVYNSGFALTLYIAQKYGEDKLREITKALGKLTNFTIDAAFKDVLGKDGNEIYNEWSEFVRNDYIKRTASVSANLVQGELLAQKGFGNFYPTYSADGSKMIYISNKNSDYFSPSSIYLRDMKTGEEKEITSSIRSTISWVPGETKIVYAKLSDQNKNWYNVHDLYVYDLDKKKETRLTKNLRANQPDVSKDGSKIVFLFQKDGTTNLGIVNIDGTGFRQITFFQNGEQVYNPKFSNDDSFIIFDYSYHQTRDIVSVHPDGSNFKKVITTEHDERNPVIDHNGNMIYASDETGIFNLYSIDMKTGIKKKLTNVTGGAFMPSVSPDGNIVYAGYTSTGYKIFSISREDQLNADNTAQYVRLENPPLDTFQPNGDISNFDMASLRSFNDNVTPEYKKEKYSGAFSKISFFPFIRYDNYNTSNKFTEKIKPGVYVASSDMLNRYSLFAGGSINSRWERDLFLLFDYRNKLPLFYQLGLKPELGLEVYNISRKAGVDIVFDEYDPIPTDVTYNLFEVDLAARHRFITRYQNLEFRFIFSRYSAALGSFILPDQNTLYPTTNDTYLIGNNFQVKYNLDLIKPARDMEINPVGIRFELMYNYELNKFNDEGEYEVEDGLLKPQYNNFNFHRLELNSKTHLPIFSDHTLTAQIRGGSILGEQVPDFFDFYLGGLLGMKSYPFYAISGNEIAWLNLTYRFPLFKDIDSRLGHLYFDKVFLSVYGDVGNAWEDSFQRIRLSEFKRGAGAEIRIEMNSFYLFPTSVFINASYGFDSIQREVREQIINYGKEWRFYGGVLFGFDI